MPRKFERRRCTFSPLDDVKVVAVVALPDDVVAGGHLALEHRVEDFAQLE